MGKPNGRKRALADHKSGNASSKSMKHPDRSSRSFDEDTTMFINMSQELKEEGGKLFHKRDYEGAILKYEKALKLLPRNHIDIALLRSYMAGCYMHMGLGEYPQAINECNLALEVSPRYSKALVKRAKCYGELNRLDLALRDVNTVLSVEPNNLTALEILENLRKTVEDKGIKFDEEKLNAALVPGSRLREVVREKLRKKKGKKNETDKAEDKVVVEENVGKTVDKAEMLVEPVKEDKAITRTAKLVHGDDIRWVQLPVNCSMKLVRDIIKDRFPSLKGVLVKYKDQDGDLVTITTTDELRLAESSGQVPGSIRLQITEVDPHHEPSYEEDKMKVDGTENNGATEEGEDASSRVTSVEDWIIQFARLFKNHVGCDSDSYLDLHELGMTLYSEAMEDTVTSDDAQDLFEIAADKFQEMSALAMFNWGNVHMCKARKRASFPEDGPRESALEHLRAAYEWAQKEYMRAEMKYEEALKIKPDFYEGYLALGHQRFEQAKLCWYYANACKMDLEAGPADQVIELYNKAEDSMEKGIFMLEQIEEQRLNGISKSEKHKARLNKVGLDGLLNDVSFVDATEQCRSMTSQINLLWGTLLYERSVVEYKLHLPTWEECLEVSVEKFELAGVCQTDIAVMIKNHCSNVKSSEGWGFKIDELVQAWNEMYDAQRWQFGTPSFRLEPLFRRRAPKIHEILEQF